MVVTVRRTICMRRPSICFAASFALLLVTSFVSPGHASAAAARMRWFVSPVDNTAGLHLHVLPGGGVVVAGSTLGYNGGDDMFVSRLDPQGRVVWTKLAMGRYVRDVVGTGEHVFFGTEFSGNVRLDDVRLQSVGHTGGFLAKLDANGSTQWGRVLNSPDFTRMDGLVATDDGGVVAALGLFWGAPRGPLHVPVAGGKDIVLAKLGEDGEVAWVRTFGWKGYDEASTLLQRGSEMVLAGTRWNSSSTSEPGRVDGRSHGWVTRLDHEGKTIWETSLGRRVGHVTVDQAALGAGGLVVVAGRFRGINHIGDAAVGAAGAFGGYTAALDETGRVVWVREQRDHEVVTGIALWPERSCLAVDERGRVLLAGSKGIALQTDVGVSWLMRFDDDAAVGIVDCATDGEHLYLTGGTRPGAVVAGKRLERLRPRRSWFRSFWTGFVARVDL
jgi:hypothetical protein